MAHLPYGYAIINGKAVVVDEEAGKVKQIFKNYISGMSLSESAKSAGYPVTHSMVKRLLQKKCYLGDSFYPKIIDESEFIKANDELVRRGKNFCKYGITSKKLPVIHTDFYIGESKEQQEDFTKQAEYLYSLIEVK